MGNKKRPVRSCPECGHARTHCTAEKRWALYTYYRYECNKCGHRWTFTDPENMQGNYPRQPRRQRVVQEPVPLPPLDKSVLLAPRVTCTKCHATVLLTDLCSARDCPTIQSLLPPAEEKAA